MYEVIPAWPPAEAAAAVDTTAAHPPPGSRALFARAGVGCFDASVLRVAREGTEVCGHDLRARAEVFRGRVIDSRLLGPVVFEGFPAMRTELVRALPARSRGGLLALFRRIAGRGRAARLLRRRASRASGSRGLRTGGVALLAVHAPALCVVGRAPAAPLEVRAISLTGACARVDLPTVRHLGRRRFRLSSSGLGSRRWLARSLLRLSSAATKARCCCAACSRSRAISRVNRAFAYSTSCFALSSWDSSSLERARAAASASPCWEISVHCLPAV